MGRTDARTKHGNSEESQRGGKEAYYTDSHEGALTRRAFRSSFSPADDIRVAVSGVFVVLTRSIAFVVIEDLESFKGFAQSIFFKKIDKPATILLEHERPWLDHFLRGTIIIELRVEIVSRRHDDGSAGFHGAFQSRQHRVELAPLHAANDKKADDHIVGRTGISIGDRTPPLNCNIRKLVVAAIVAKSPQMVLPDIDGGDVKIPLRKEHTV